MAGNLNRERTLRALINAAYIRARRLSERLKFERAELKALTRALKATTRAADIEADLPTFQTRVEKVG